jgi:large subunit ribosomal protein L4
MYMETKVYSQDGKESGKLTLPEAVFGIAWNKDLMHEVVVGMQSNARAGTAHTKDRSEVRGGGKKPWKQKGTGRARHGSRRSPIWAGGGVAHGPRNEKDYSKKINKNAKAKALAITLSKKYADGEMVFVDSFSFAEPKTKDAKVIVKALAQGAHVPTLATKRKNAALVLLPKRNESVEKSFRNFGNMDVMQAKDVNPVELLTYKFVLVADAKASLEVLQTRIVKKVTEKKS